MGFAEFIVESLDEVVAANECESRCALVDDSYNNMHWGWGRVGTYVVARIPPVKPKLICSAL